MKKRLNSPALFKGLALAGFGIFFIAETAGGGAAQYVHPRVFPFLIVAGCVMLLMAVFQFALLFEDRRGGSAPILLFFLLPLALALAVLAQSFNAEAASAGEISLSGMQAAETAGASIGTDDGPVEMDGSNFYTWLNALYADAGSYAGRPVSVTGFVFRDRETFADNQFVPARMMMTCCAADMVPVGLLCLFDGASQLEDGAWVSVAGSVGITEFNGEAMPCILAENVTPVEKPAEEYIYPY